METRRGLLQTLGVAGSALASGVLGAACGAGSGDPGSTLGAVGNPSKLTTVSVWHAWDGTREPFIKQIAERMKQQWPNLTVDPQVVPTQDANNQAKLVVAVAAGNAPDVVMLYIDYIPDFGPAKQILQNHDAWIKRDKINLKDVFYEADVEGCQMDGKTWELPHTLSTLPVIVLFNKILTARAGLDLDKNPPQTWDELMQVAQNLNIRDGSGLQQLGVDLRATTSYFDVYAGTNGTAAFSPDNKKVTFNEPKAIEAMEFLVNTRKALGGRSVVEPFVSANVPNGSYSDLFSKLFKLGMTHNQVGFAGFAQGSPDLVNPDGSWRFGAFVVPPKQKGAQMALPHRQAWAWGMLASSKEKDAAWLLTRKYTVDEDGAGWLMVQLGRPSPIRKVQESGDFKKNNPYWQEANKALAARWKRPPSFISPDVNKAWTDLVSKINNEEVSPRSGLTDGAAQVQGVLDQYWASKK